MKKAYDALFKNGAFNVIENVIDNERKKNVFGLMMSLNMLIETPEGAEYTVAEYELWAKEVGFKKTAIIPLTGGASAAIAYN